MTKSDTLGWSIVAVVVMMLVAWATYWIGFAGGVKKMERIAVRQGHAGYTSDSSGKAAFTWNEVKVQQFETVEQ